VYKQVDHLLHYTKKKNNLGCNNRTKQHVISKELYEFCLDQGYADRNLIVKWKKVPNICFYSIFEKAFVFSISFIIDSLYP